MKFKSVVPVVCAGVALGLGVVACGGDDRADTPRRYRDARRPRDGGAAPRRTRDVKVAFSAPAADHGWLKALSDNAKAKAEELGLDMTVNDSATTSAEQADQIETLIQEKPDVLVVLPNEGEPLTPVAQKAMDQGIQVINIDREFSTAVRVPHADRRRQLRHRRAGRQLLRRPAASARATSWRSRASPASR